MVQGGRAGDDDFVRNLQRMVADAAADSAATDRSRERWMRQAAEEEATLAGTVLELAERAAPVIVRTSAGRAHRGRILAVANDFLVLRDALAAPVFVPFHAVTSIRPGEPAAGDASGSRAAPLDVSLAAMLTALAVDRPRVQIAPAGDEPIAGTLRSSGSDVVTLDLDGGGRLVAHVSTAAVADVVLLDL